MISIVHSKQNQQLAHELSLWLEEGGYTTGAYRSVKNISRQLLLRLRFPRRHSYRFSGTQCRGGSVSIAHRYDKTASYSDHTALAQFVRCRISPSRNSLDFSHRARIDHGNTQRRNGIHSLTCSCGSESSRRTTE